MRRRTLPLRASLIHAGRTAARPRPGSVCPITVNLVETTRARYTSRMQRPEIRVQFAHGLESSPQGNKARILAAHFTALTPNMDTRDLASCIDVHARAIASFRPHLLIGSSFGGAVAVTLLARGLYRGPTLLLAQAAARYLPAPSLPEGVPVTLVHGTRDDVIPLSDSEALARTGSPALVRLLTRDDDHALTALCAGGELVTLVERCVASERA